MVQTLPAEDFSRVYSPDVTRTLEQRVPGVFISDVQGNEFTPDLRYRGFAASPLQGTPQGLAVYMQGVRVNEAFGDTVNWDLIPTIAIGRADVWTNNPLLRRPRLEGHRCRGPPGHEHGRQFFRRDWANADRTAQ